MPPRPKAHPAMGPMNPEPGTSTLQSISNQHCLSEQPEDLQSIHTPDDDLEPINKGNVRVPIFPIVVCVRSTYVIGARVGFRVESGAVALLQLDV